MHPFVEAALPEIRELCQRLGVARLDLFGSASGSTWSHAYLWDVQGAAALITQFVTD